jgi:hypothetical protein
MQNKHKIYYIKNNFTYKIANFIYKFIFPRISLTCFFEMSAEPSLRTFPFLTFRVREIVWGPQRHKLALVQGRQGDPRKHIHFQVVVESAQPQEWPTSLSKKAKNWVNKKN